MIVIAHKLTNEDQDILKCCLRKGHIIIDIVHAVKNKEEVEGAYEGIFW